MKVSHTLPNSVNPIRFSRIRLGVSNHLILIITLNAWNLLQPLTMGMSDIIYTRADGSCQRAFRLVDLVGFEPTTSSVQARRSPNWSYKPRKRPRTYCWVGSSRNKPIHYRSNASLTFAFFDLQGLATKMHILIALVQVITPCHRP